jgi:hypothetical protein
MLSARIIAQPGRVNADIAYYSVTRTISERVTSSASLLGQLVDLKGTVG